MESNSNPGEKKPKRPRIGQAYRPEETGESRPRFDNSNFSARYNNSEPAADGEFQKRPYSSA